MAHILTQISLTISPHKQGTYTTIRYFTLDAISDSSTPNQALAQCQIVYVGERDNRPSHIGLFIVLRQLVDISATYAKWQVAMVTKVTSEKTINAKITGAFSQVFWRRL